MENILSLRKQTGLSQRRFAHKAKLSFRTLQLLEAEKHDPKLSTLEKISLALGYGKDDFKQAVRNFFDSPPLSIKNISMKLQNFGTQNSWQILFFDFVDEFRRHKQLSLIKESPVNNCSLKFKALLASTVECLCDENSYIYPDWCKAIGVVKEPWFISEVESLKASALLESPVHYRKRNIFVLDNFLNRA